MKYTRKDQRSFCRDIARLLINSRASTVIFFKESSALMEEEN